jgi:hypothetical protein
VRRTATTLSLLFLLGCSYPVTIMDPEVQRQWYPFLEERVRLADMRTTRREVRESFGEPSATLKDGRIWAYRMLLDKDEYFLYVDREAETEKSELAGWSETVRVSLPESAPADEQGKALRSEAHRYSLVLVFEEDVLQRHNLVRLR